MRPSIIVKEVFLISSISQTTLMTTTNDRKVKILFESAIIVHKGMHLNINEAMKVSTEIDLPFKVLVSGVTFDDCADGFSILALAMEIPTSLDVDKKNDALHDTTEISGSRLKEV
jgi:hypothetical protein